MYASLSASFLDSASSFDEETDEHSVALLLRAADKDVDGNDAANDDNNPAEEEEEDEEVDDDDRGRDGC
ncbi:hypothetical protein D3C80_2167240 [compost metagenome]